MSANIEDQLADMRDELVEALKDRNRLNELVATHWLVADDQRLEDCVYYALASEWYQPEGPRDFDRDTKMRRGLAAEIVAALRGQYVPGPSTEGTSNEP